LHFRLEIGREATIVVEARLVASPGSATGYDTVLLDLDGDGKPETRRPIGERVHLRTKRTVRDVRIPIRHEGAIFTLELDALKSPVSARALAAGTTEVHWSVHAGGLYVRFLESPLTLHSRAEDVRSVAPFRMGPPLSFVLETRTRGPNPTVETDLRDPNGGSLAMVVRDGKEVRPEVKVLAAGEEKIAARPGYS
jgi:hypothetical protein